MSRQDADETFTDDDREAFRDLFDGDEPATCECSGDDDPTIAETDAFDAGLWFSTVTYKEIHSFVLGFAPIFLLFSVGPAFPIVVEPLALFAASITLGAFYCQKVPNSTVRRWLCREPHYALGGQVAGVLVALPLFFLLGGV